MPMRFAIKPKLVRIWHAPEHFRLMDPLPPLHRRGIIIAAAIVVIGFLLPTPNEPDRPVTRDAQLSIESQTPMHAELVNPPTNTTPAAPVEPAPVQPSVQPEAQSQAPVPHANNDIEQQWRSYRVESGQTLAQLFRDHNLPPTDVYAMAQVQGDNQPLRTLQTGQMVKIRQNANGIVTGLSLDSGSGEVLFTRQPDGSFLRAQ
ncbi:LysM-like peptidoglycan-binding domain-containing protein [Dryocola clanedunensis]|uniref:LysM-like peptidoglycan-binding domain-containing protein n=1 Tax=Cedecea sulfonylureivorans TaxID=3051154 RepID=UPI001925A76B|nr:LysM-like peptidoglycan-binding domain-containing protein [Cedecea sulfonylureivorans]